MIATDTLRALSAKTPSKILMLVVDGLGGLPHPDTGKTELETAYTPNLDRLARQSTLGLIEIAGPGISPGSGPGHLALFGYDPARYLVGRGVLSALGVGFPLQPGDVAARVNFATVGPDGLVLDRRAGRIPTALTTRLCQKLSAIKLPGVEIHLLPERDYRAVLILRGPGLSDQVSETDPQRTGLPPLLVRPLAPEAGTTADLLNAYLARAFELLRDEHPANAILLRGIASLPHIPSLRELYQLDAAAVAVYPMYRGLARLVGMEVLELEGETLADEVAALRAAWPRFDFLFLHVKPADSAGEDGDFARKVAIIEQIDAIVPELEALGPEVLVVTGDHSTPSTMRSHSWHPVPFLLRSRWAMPYSIETFGEREARRGYLGVLPGWHAMAHMLAHAGKLSKYGA